MFTLNKYTIAAIIIILLIVAYIFYRWYWNKDSKSKKSKKNKRSKKSHKKSRKEDDDEEDENDKVHDDAEALYNLIHTDMCNNMQQNDFEKVAGDLANAIIFIELRQMYNECNDRNLDPMRTITVEDYYRVLRKEGK